MFAWMACRPIPMKPMPMRLLGAVFPSIPTAAPGTNMGSAKVVPAATAVLRRKLRRVNLSEDGVLACNMAISSLGCSSRLLRQEGASRKSAPRAWHPLYQRKPSVDKDETRRYSNVFRSPGRADASDSSRFTTCSRLQHLIDLPTGLSLLQRAITGRRQRRLRTGRPPCRPSRHRGARASQLAERSNRP